MTDKSDQAQLVEQLEEDRESFFSRGVSNNIIDIALTVSIVVTSLVAACLAVSDLHNRWIIALIAGMPAAAAAIQTKVGIRERSDWYFLYAAELRAMATELKYARSPSMEEYARKRGKLEKAMEAEWKKIGRHMPRTPRRRG